MEDRKEVKFKKGSKLKGTVDVDLGNLNKAFGTNAYGAWAILLFEDDEGQKCNSFLRGDAAAFLVGWSPEKGEEFEIEWTDDSLLINEEDVQENEILQKYIAEGKEKIKQKKELQTPDRQIMIVRQNALTQTMKELELQKDLVIAGHQEMEQFVETLKNRFKKAEEYEKWVLRKIPEK